MKHIHCILIFSFSALLISSFYNIVLLKQQQPSIELLTTIEEEILMSSDSLPNEFDKFPNNFHLENENKVNVFYDSLSLVLNARIQTSINTLGTQFNLIDYWSSSCWSNKPFLIDYSFNNGLNIGRIYIAINHSVKPRKKELLPVKIEGEYPVLIRTEVIVYTDYIFQKTKKHRFIIESNKFMLDNCHFTVQ